MERIKSYSGLLIITPDKEDALDKVKKDISSIIKDNAGNVVKENMMGKRTLGYPIKKKKEGLYYEVIFNAPSANISHIMRQIQINTNILRAIIDRKD